MSEQAGWVIVFFTIGFVIGFLACALFMLGQIEDSFDDGYRLGRLMAGFDDWFRDNFGDRYGD